MRKPQDSLVCCLGGLALLLLLNGMALAADQPSRPIDDSRARAAGIRKLTSKRLTLYTDLAPAAVVDELPEVFDQAFPQWCVYFGVDPQRHADWHITGFLMKEKSRFEASGLLPGDLPAFLNGFARQQELWLYNQTSDYYRRHLLLHEGTHGFMFSLLGACGPPWYSEGMAELMATHRWHDGRLTLNYFPTKAAEVPKLGRIEIVETDVANHRGRSIGEVLAYDTHAHLKVEPYGWSWAAAAFLDNHPRYRERFHQMWHDVGEADFNKRFAKRFAADGAELAEEWQVFASDLAYGYDFKRTAIDFTPGKAHGRSHASERGGRQGLAETPVGNSKAGGRTTRAPRAGIRSPRTRPAWVSEPGGVSIRYVHGKPLGVLLAAVRPAESSTGESGAGIPNGRWIGDDASSSEIGNTLFTCQYFVRRTRFGRRNADRRNRPRVTALDRLRTYLMPANYPLRFEPIFRRYLWGGRRLGTVLGKPIGEGSDFAESWEIVDHGRDQSRVVAGPLAGMALGEIVARHGKELFGQHAPHASFPLLFKFLDAREPLSVQVHPNDAQAARLDPPDAGKTEAWVVLAAEPGSLLYAGLKARIRSAGARARSAARDVRALSPSLRAASRRLHFSSGGDRACHRARTADGRNSAGQ